MTKAELVKDIVSPVYQTKKHISQKADSLIYFAKVAQSLIFEVHKKKIIR